MEEDVPWLDDGWDPRTVTMPRLRAILLENGVAYPGNARKAALVRLFEEQVAPQRERLRASKLRAARVVTRPSEVTDMRAAPDVQTVSASPRSSDAQQGRKASPARRSEKHQHSASPHMPSVKKEEPASPPRAHRRSASFESLSDQSPAPKGKAPASSTPAPKSSRRSPSTGTRPLNAVLASRPHSPKPAQPRRSILHAGSDGESDLSRKKLKGRASVTFNDQVEYYDEEADKSNFSHVNPFQQSSPDQSLDAQLSNVTASPQPNYLKYQMQRDAAAPNDSPADESTSFSRSLRNASRWIGQVQARLAGWEEDSFSGSSFSDEDQEVVQQEDAVGENDEVESEKEEQIDATGADWTAAGLAESSTDHTFDPGTDPSPSMYVWRQRQDRIGTPRSPSPTSTTTDKVAQVRRPVKVAGFFLHSLTRLLLWSVAMYVIMVYYVRARESRAIGYCDTATESNRELVRRRLIPHSTDVQNPALLDVVPPVWLPDACTPCPAHAECRHGVFRGCSTVDYFQADSTWGALPPLVRAFLPLDWLAPACVPDTHKLVLALEVGAEVERLLATWHGEVKCGISPPFEAAAGGRLSLTEREDAGALPASQVQEDLWDRMESSIDRDYFDQLWNMALTELSRAGDIEVVSGSENGSYGQLLYTPRAAMPLRCRANLAMRTFVRRFRLLGTVVLVLLISVAWLRYRLAATAQARVKVHHLVQVSLDRLIEAARQNMLYPNFHPNPWLATTQLRDEVLSGEYNVVQRKRLWGKVARIVEENTNVRTRQAKMAGDWVKAWEWIGTIPTAFSSSLPVSPDPQRAHGERVDGTPFDSTPRSRRSTGVGFDPDQTGASAIEASRFLQPDTGDADRTGLSAFEASRLLQTDQADETDSASQHGNTSRPLSLEVDRTNASHAIARRVHQPTGPDMEEKSALHRRYF